MDILYEIRKLARQLCCYRTNPLQWFTEAEGSVLARKGGGSTLTLAETTATLSTPDTEDGGVDLVLGDTTFSVGVDNEATGAYSSVLGGTANTASGDYSTVVAGVANAASGERSTVIGGASNLASGYGASVLGGDSNQAVGDYSIAAGYAARARHHGEHAFAGGAFGVAGDAQHGNLFARATTTDNTPTVITLDGVAAAGGSGVKITPLDDEVWGIRVRLVGVCKAASKAWVYDLEFAVTNFGGTLAQLGTTDVALDKKTGSTTWTATPYVASDTISLTVTGANSETIRWFAAYGYARVTGV